MTQPNQNQLTGWLACATASLFVLFVSALMQLPNSIGPELLKKFSLDAARLGWFSSSYFIANLILLIPAGLLLDKLPIRYVMLTGMFIALLGVITLAADSFALVLGGRVLSGIGATLSFAGCIKLASHWFPTSHLGRINSLIFATGIMGGLLAQLPTLYIMRTFGWDGMVISYFVLGLIIFGLMYLGVYDTAQEHYDADRNTYSSTQRIKATLGRKRNWFFGIYVFCINAPLYILGGQWGSLFLEQVYGLPELTASCIVTLLFSGAILGAPFLGWFSDRIQRRTLLVMVNICLCIIILALLIYLPDSPVFPLGLLFFLLGIIISAQLLCYALLIEHNPKYTTATASSFVSLCSLLGGAAVSPIFGNILDHGVQVVTPNGVPIYSVSTYQMAIGMLIGICVIGALISIWLKEKNNHLIDFFQK